MSHQSTLIELRGVSKRYGSVEALRDVDLAVQTRQIVGLYAKRCVSNLS